MHRYYICVIIFSMVFITTPFAVQANVFGSLFHGLSSKKKDAIIQFAEAHAQSVSPSIASGVYHKTTGCEPVTGENKDAQRFQVILEYYNSEDSLLPMYDFDIVVETDGRKTPQRVLSIDDKVIDWPCHETVSLTDDQRKEIMEYSLAICDSQSPSYANTGYELVAGCARDLSIEDTVATVVVEYYNTTKEGKRALVPINDWKLSIALDSTGKPLRLLTLNEQAVDYPVREVRRIRGEHAQTLIQFGRIIAQSKEPVLASGEWLELAGAAYDFSQPDESIVKIELEYYNSSQGKKALCPWVDFDIVARIDKAGDPVTCLSVNGEPYELATNLVVLPKEKQEAIIAFARAYAECKDPANRGINYTFVGGCTFDLKTEDRTQINVVLEFYRHFKGKKALCPFYDYTMVVALDSDYTPLSLISLDGKPCNYPAMNVRRLTSEENKCLLDFAKKYIHETYPEVRTDGYVFNGGAAIDLQSAEQSVVKVKAEWFRRGDDGKPKLCPFYEYLLEVSVDSHMKPLHVVTVNDTPAE